MQYISDAIEYLKVVGDKHKLICPERLDTYAMRDIRLSVGDKHKLICLEHLKLYAYRDIHHIDTKHALCILEELKNICNDLKLDSADRENFDNAHGFLEISNALQIFIECFVPTTAAAV